MTDIRKEIHDLKKARGCSTVAATLAVLNEKKKAEKSGKKQCVDKRKKEK